MKIILPNRKHLQNLFLLHNSNATARIKNKDTIKLARTYCLEVESIIKNIIKNLEKFYNKKKKNILKIVVFI